MANSPSPIQGQPSRYRIEQGGVGRPYTFGDQLRDGIEGAADRSATAPPTVPRVNQGVFGAGGGFSPPPPALPPTVVQPVWLADP